MSTLEVEVKFYAMLREVAKKKAEIVVLSPKSSVRSLLDLLIQRYGGEFGNYVYDNEKRIRNYLSFMLNGVNINSAEGFDTILKDGDSFSLLPPVGGG